jgi:hypothetical protein
MPITLTSFSAGDVAYITKLNNNFTTLQTAINALQTNTGTGTTAAAFDEVWKASGLIGASAFSYTLVSNTHLQLGSGSVWFLAQQTRARATSATQLAFLGLASGLYYVNCDTAGGLSVSTARQGCPLYTVYYSAPSFASATRLLPVLLDGEDYARMLSSPAYGSFVRVADRLSAIEVALAAVSGGSGGGSGLSGVTASGAMQARWTVALSVASAPSALTGGFQVYRGSDAANSAPELRWNEGLDRWEFTNDSSSYTPLGSLEGLNLGAGRATRLVVVTSAPIVLNEPGRSATSLAEVSTLSLSAYVSTTTLAAVLRGYMLDSAPGSALALGSVAGIAFYRDSATLVGDAAAKVVAVASAGLRYDEIWVPVSNQACAYVVETASICSVRFALVAYVDTVQGVGTQLVSGTRAGIGVSAGVGSHMKLSSTLFAAAMLRGLVHYVETSGSMGAGSLYDVEFYGSLSGAQSQLTSALLFQATQIEASAAYLTRLPWMHIDADSLTQMYLRLSNHGTTSGSFSVVVRGEQYA